MSIRPATASDQPAVVALDAACFPKDAWSSGSWAGEFTRADREILVAGPSAGESSPVVPSTSGADSGRLRGFVVLLVPAVEDDPVDLLRIAVDPAYRRTGLGRRLLAAALEQHQARSVLLEVAAGNEAAIGLYAGFGFAELSRRRGYYTGGEDAVVMQRVGEPR
ncbi:GNAT family N-acetyltransferase [Kribbella sp. DT2]|uniref:GNAT family N-acetyltransferase n=1 Tax=Kribbella sp. DT2 TaxID=3393427 RepID=UPI003CF2130C